jgi:hypothetical protein
LAQDYFLIECSKLWLSSSVRFSQTYRWNCLLTGPLGWRITIRAMEELVDRDLAHIFQLPSWIYILPCIVKLNLHSAGQTGIRFGEMYRSVLAVFRSIRSSAENFGKAWLICRWDWEVHEPKKKGSVQTSLRILQ